MDDDAERVVPGGNDRPHRDSWTVDSRPPLVDWDPSRIGRHAAAVEDRAIFHRIAPDSRLAPARPVSVPLQGDRAACGGDRRLAPDGGGPPASKEALCGDTQ